MKSKRCVQFVVFGEFGHKFTIHRELTEREIAENKIAREDIPERCLGYCFFTMDKDGNKSNFLSAVYFGQVASFEEFKKFCEENGDTKLSDNIKDKKILISNLGSIELINPWDTVINF